MSELMKTSRPFSINLSLEKREGSDYFITSNLMSNIKYCLHYVSYKIPYPTFLVMASSLCATTFIDLSK